jgi:serine/threonine protein kinase
MPSPTTIDEFLDLVRKSTVADEKRLTTHLEKLRAAGPLPADPASLATVLVRDGILTHFQAEQLLQGKWRRFSIGKYKVLERLGAGGMGSVYLCEHKLMRRRVALKVLPTAKAEDPSSLERFYREARAVAALDHPNIVRAYDIDQEDKLHFLVMEHVDGSSLQEIVKRAGPMDVLRACHYIRQAAMGLQHAHETAGLVHRDIKPGNILVDRNGIVKVLDMGLARFFHDEDDILTKKYDENVLGTADYLAPEQALDSHSVDIRADIYSLGATFYFCLTGKTPFAEGTVAQKLIWHQTRQPKPLKTFRADIPDGVAAVIDKMMAKDANQRYQMPQHVVDAMSSWTQTPIPPPPDEEMPQFSLAAMGGPSTESGMTTPGRGAAGEPSPPPRKAWQVPGSSNSANSTPRAVAAPKSPTPPPTPSAPPPPQVMQPPVVQRKPVPPPGPVAARPALAPPQPPSPRPQPRPASAAPPAPPPAVKPTTNGQYQARISATTPPPVSVEQDTDAWEQLVEAAESRTIRSDSTPRAGTKARSGSHKRITTQHAADGPVDRRMLWWIVGGAVAACVVAGLLVWWALRGRSQAPNAIAQVAPTLFVSDQRPAADDVVSSLGTAIKRIKQRPRLGGRIILERDVAEEVQIEEVDNVSIEAQEGRQVTWRPPSGTLNGKLLLLHSTPNFHLKGLMLDGQGREQALISVWGNCRGTVLDDLSLKGFQNYGLWVANCKGEHGQLVIFSRLRIVTVEAKQCGFYFDLNPAIRDIPTNEQIAVRECMVQGAATAKVRAKSNEAVNRVELAADLLPPAIGS